LIKPGMYLMLYAHAICCIVTAPSRPVRLFIPPIRACYDSICAIYPRSHLSSVSPSTIAEPESLIKRHHLEEGWQLYTTPVGGQSLDLPSFIFAMLNDNQFVPEPRANFLEVLQNVQPGQSIMLPNLGDHPKHFGEGYQKKTFLVTQQMI